MPWVPFFLKSLLEWDCPIVIAEGAANVKVYNSDRSVDGSLQIIKEFQRNWPDRVTIKYHHYNPNAKTVREKQTPKAKIKMEIFSQLPTYDWMVGLAPDNFYTSQDIKKIKQFFAEAPKQVATLVTQMKTFCFNFETVVERKVRGICGPWVNLWPCVYRQHPNFPMVIGDEVLRDKMNESIVHPQLQWGKEPSNPNIRVRRDIVNFHYKSVKKESAKAKRLRRTNHSAPEYMNYPIAGQCMKPYKGPHPKVLDDHPWRHVEDCRKEPDVFFPEDFFHLVRKNP
jgi:hypothetical protein